MLSRGVRGMTRERRTMQQRTVLLLDANMTARTHIADALAERGYAVRVGASIRAGEAVLRAHHTDCAIVDVALEDMPGHLGIERLHKIAPRMPVVVTAAENTRELEAEVRQQDIVYYYVKSFDEAELLEAVREAVDGGHAQLTGKILVVDDSPDFQDAIRTVLEGAGYAVISAYSKDEGKAKLLAEHPDLVILDMVLETATAGFRFIYETLDDQEHVPILAVSAIGDMYGLGLEVTDKDDYFPADDYLEKPLKPGELLERVERLLERN